MATEVPDFLKKWIDNIESNSLNSLYILPFRKLTPSQFTLLLNSIANCTSLTTFSASGHSIEKESHSALYNALTKNGSLISLDLGDNKLGIVPEDEKEEEDCLFSVLCRAMGQNRSIQTWNLDYKSIGLRASKIFSDKVLFNNNTLLTVSLSRNQLGDDGCIELCNGFLKSHNKTIKILNLIDNGIGPRGIKEGIAKLLKWEVPESSPVDDSPLSSHCYIKELDISLNKFGDEGGIAIGEVLKDNIGLRKINLSNTDIGDDTIISICNSLKSTITDECGSSKNQYKLTKMISQSSIMTDDSLNAASTTSTITTLMLNNNNITSKSCPELASLLAISPRLKKLSLINNNIGDEGIKILTTEGMNSVENTGNLEILDLSKNNITFDGFKYILQYIPKVKIIVLHCNRICDWSEEFIKSLKFDEQFIGCSSLKELHLTENGVKTSDMKLLCGMIKDGFAKGLEELVLGANVSLDQEEDWNQWEQSITELENLKPKLSITWK